ncbi:MAG: hypothetical protein KA287_07420, partial [Rhodoferax sp.]|nr:hypothetical protein [Rhodoferax sp.]
MKIQTLIATAALALSGVAFAQTTVIVPKDPTATPRVDQHQANQEKRIDQGTASGALTPAEAARLEAGQAKNDAAEARMKADGTVT